MDDDELDSRVIEIRECAEREEFEKGIQLIHSLFEDSVRENLGIIKVENQSYFDFIETIVYFYGDAFRDGSYQMVKVFTEIERDKLPLDTQRFDESRGGLLRFLISLTSDPEFQGDRIKRPQSPQDFRSLIFGISAQSDDVRKAAIKILRKYGKKRLASQWQTIAADRKVEKQLLRILTKEKKTKKMAKHIKKGIYESWFEDSN
ncbi:MAG: hypothetical protein ACFFCQ_06525 [Promethearchaeota archaeon]